MTEKWGYGNPEKERSFGWNQFQDGTPFEILWGEHPHSRQDNKQYARLPDGSIEGFNGHRVRTRVEIEESNYLKVSGLSGNEVRRQCLAKIYFDDFPIYQFTTRDAQPALRKADALITQLMEHPIALWDEEGRKNIEGRKIYYRDVPAIVRKVDWSQGEIYIERANGESFPSPPWSDEDEEDSVIKDDFLTPHIWWFRD